LSPYEGRDVLYPGFPDPQAHQVRVLGQGEVVYDEIIGPIIIIYNTRKEGKKKTKKTGKRLNERRITRRREF
jgi:hypothetical protein